MWHAGITFMLEAGVNPRAIQKLAGWTSMRMLERYGHVRDAELQRAVRVARTFTDVFQGSRDDSSHIRVVEARFGEMVIVQRSWNGFPSPE